MLIERAFVLKGWLLGKDAPDTILATVDALIAVMRENSHPEVPVVAADIPADRVAIQAEACEVPTVPDPDIHAVEATPKKKHNWSPEARKAQGERMRVRMALKKAKSPQPDLSPPKPFTPVPAEKLIADHGGYAGRRDPGQALVDDDWHDIKVMLNVKRLSVSRIASDYDVDFDTLRAFIDRHQAQAEHRVGNFAAPSAGGA